MEKNLLQFQEITTKYKLDKRAEEISLYLTSTENINAEDFAKKFDLDIEDAKFYLSFIEFSLKIKEKNNLHY